MFRRKPKKKAKVKESQGDETGGDGGETSEGGEKAKKRGILGAEPEELGDELADLTGTGGEGRPLEPPPGTVMQADGSAVTPDGTVIPAEALPKRNKPLPPGAVIQPDGSARAPDGKVLPREPQTVAEALDP